MPEPLKYQALVDGVTTATQGRPSPFLEAVKRRGGGTITDAAIVEQLREELTIPKRRDRAMKLITEHGMLKDISAPEGGSAVPQAEAALGGLSSLWDMGSNAIGKMATNPVYRRAFKEEMGQGALSGLTSNILGRQTPPMSQDPDEIGVRMFGNLGGQMMGTVGQGIAIHGGGLLARRAPVVGPLIAALETGVKALPSGSGQTLKKLATRGANYVRENIPDLAGWGTSGLIRGDRMVAEGNERYKTALAEGRTPDAEMNEYQSSGLERLGRTLGSGVFEMANAALPSKFIMEGAKPAARLASLGKSIATTVGPQTAVNAAQEGIDAALSGRDKSDAMTMGGTFGGVLSGTMGTGGALVDAAVGRYGKAGRAARAAARANVAAAGNAPGQTAATPINTVSAALPRSQGLGQEHRFDDPTPSVLVSPAEREKALAWAEKLAELHASLSGREGITMPPVKQVPNAWNITKIDAEGTPRGVLLKQGPAGYVDGGGETHINANETVASLRDAAGNAVQVPYSTYRQQPGIVDHTPRGTNVEMRTPLPAGYSDIRPFKTTLFGMNDPWYIVGRTSAAPADASGRFDATGIRWIAFKPDKDDPTRGVYYQDVPATASDELRKATDAYLQHLMDQRARTAGGGTFRGKSMVEAKPMLSRDVLQQKQMERFNLGDLIRLSGLTEEEIAAIEDTMRRRRLERNPF